MTWNGGADKCPRVDPNVVLPAAVVQDATVPSKMLF